ncbi:MAG: guanylate kinase [Bacilli bacterium]|jgi:guanylate kinase
MKQGLLIILSGPSGVGKGSLRKKLNHEPDFKVDYSVSMTTRPKRFREMNGKDYIYVGLPEFEQKIKENYFIEYVNYCGNYYGTPKSFVDTHLLAGRNVLLEIEADGAEQVMKQYRGIYTLAVFVIPPTMEELERRIRLRNTETEEQIQARLEKAKKEMALKDNYDVVLTNYTLNKTALRFKQVVNNRLTYIKNVEAGNPVSKEYVIKRP